MDHTGNNKFRALLDIFHSIIEGMPPAEDIKDKLLSLKEMAKQSGEINSRQQEAILDRCDNYLKGEYGNTKTADHFGHGKPEKK